MLRLWLLVACALVVAHALWASPAFAAPAAPGQASPRPKPDMRVLIDVSGSMKKTDPANLRVPATKLLLNLAQPGSKMGLWTFGHYVNALMPLSTVDQAWKQRAVRESDKIGSVALFTNIGDALEAASRDAAGPDPAWDRTMVLLSDGMVDISKNPADNTAEQQRIFAKVVPELVRKGFKVHSVALSEQADKAFLQRIAAETGGKFSLASTADQLMNVFVGASDRVNQPLQVPMENGKFAIDASITEFTALIYRRAGSAPSTLKAPSGKRYSAQTPAANVNWFNDARFDLVTVQKPEQGQWLVEGDLDPDNRVTVVSNLDLVVGGLPNDVIAGEKITLAMHLAEKGKPIVHPHFLSLMDITFAQQVVGGEKFEGKLSRDRAGNAVVPPDGIYTAKLGRTLTEGEHEFTVAVDGKTFQRIRKAQMTVHKEALAGSVETEFVEGKEQQFVSLTPRVGLVKPESLGLVAEVVDPSGAKSIQEVIRTQEGGLRVNVPPLAGDGIYSVLVRVQGLTSSGNAFEVAQGPYDIDYTPVGADAVTTAPPQDVATEATDLHDALDVADVEEPEVATPGEDSGLSLDEEPPATDKTGDAPESKDESAAEGMFSGENIWMLLGVFAAGNVLLFGGGAWLYFRFLKKQDEEQEKLVQQIASIRNANAPETDAASFSSGFPPPIPPPPPELPLGAAPELMSAPALEIPSLEEADEPTLVRESESASVLEPFPDTAPGFASADVEIELTPEPAPAPAPVAVEPLVDREYRIEAEPLALEEDEMVEFDDELGDDEVGAQLSAHAAAQQAARQEAGEEPPLPEVVTVVPASPVSPEPAADASGLDELDMILAEQEALEARLSSLESSPAPVKKPEEEDDKNKFAEDEFMLDNPTNRS